MSAVLNKTWSILSSNISSIISSGPRWIVPDSELGPAAHLPQALAQFLNALYSCQTKDEEVDLVQKHMAQVQDKLRDSTLKTSGMADAIVRALACHILGYNVDFINIYALQLAQKGSILEKKMGYLACTLLLKESDELILLLINTIIKDLSSKNIMEINIALSAVVYLTPVEMAPMLVPILLEKLTHAKDFIRKKSLICVQKLIQKNRELGLQLSSKVYQTLSDPDPGVVAVAIQVSRSIAEQSQECDFNLIPSLLAILDQIFNNRLPTEYTYKGIPAPWFQVDILTLLSIVVAKSKWDSDIYESLSAMILRIMDSVNVKEPAGQAIIYECIIVIAAMNKLESDSVRTSKALHFINKFLQSKQNNTKYAGLAALEIVLKSSPPKLGGKEEESVLSCLSHYDDSIKRKTLSLLYVLANKENVRRVCDKLMEHVKEADDDFQREDLIAKTIDLVDHFSLGLDWNASVLIKLLPNSTGSQRERLLTKLKNAIAPDKNDSDQMKEERKAVGKKVLRILRKVCASPKPPPPALRLFIWCLSQPSDIGDETKQSTEERMKEIIKIGQATDDISHDSWQPVLVSCLEAVMTLLSNLETRNMVDIQDFIDQCATLNTSLKVKDMAFELSFLLPQLEEVRKALKETESPDITDFSLTFLDDVVLDALKTKDAHPYLVPKQFQQEKRVPDLSGLKLTSYQVLDEDRRFVNDSDSDEISTPNVWTLEGRRAKESSDQVPVDAPTRDSCQEVETQPNVEDSVLEIDTQGWKE